MIEKNFETWMEKCDVLLERKFGMTSDTIPDMSWYDWYDSEMSVHEAVTEAIRILRDEGWW